MKIGDYVYERYRASVNLDGERVIKGSGLQGRIRDIHKDISGRTILELDLPIGQRFIPANLCTTDHKIGNDIIGLEPINYSNA